MRSLTTLDVVKDELQITGMADDAALTHRIAQASVIIGLYCGGRDFHTHPVLEVFHALDPREGRPLVLSETPVHSIASVTDSTGVPLDPALYELDASAGLLYRASEGRRAAWAAAPITVTYIAGYDAVPADVEAACLALVVAAWLASGCNQSVHAEATDSVGCLTYRDLGVDAMTIDASIAAMLRPYRVWP
jgi:hypothetical protein